MRKVARSSLFLRLTAALVVGAFTSMTIAPPAFAQGAPAAGAAKAPDKKTKDAARKAYGDGEKAYGAGDYSKAYEHFQKAYGLIPTPHAEYWMAMSLYKEGKDESAVAAFEKFLANPDASKVGDEKLSEAERAFDELKGKQVGELNLVTNPAGASVLVDGEAQPGETPMMLRLKPGLHKLTISSPGYETKQMEVNIGAGQKTDQTVELTLAQTTEPGAIGPTVEPVDTLPPEPAPAVEPRSKVPAYVTLGIAGVSAAVGTFFGIKALGAKSDYDDKPTTEGADDVERNALIADMAFGVAITLGVTGIVLLTSADSPSSPKEEAKRRSQKRRFHVAPFAGPTGGGAAARLSF
jgi:hypothetical protein